MRQEQPITLADSEPEPDIAIVAGASANYRQAHPQSAELVVEVSISTEELDRENAKLYAGAGVPEYWLVLPKQGQVLVYTQPDRENYRSCDSNSAGETIESQRIPTIAIDVSSLFD